MKRKQIILSLFLITAFFACKEEDDFTIDPTGNFATKQLMEEGNYLDETVHTIGLPIDLFFPNGSYTASISIDESTVSPAFQDAVALTQTSVTLTNRADTFDILTVDFSALDPGDEDVITLTMTAEGLNLEKSRTEINVSIKKDALPVLNLGGATKSYLLKLDETGTKTFEIEMEVFDKPLLEDISIPLSWVNDGDNVVTLDIGVHFNMDTVLTVNAGETTWSFTLDVDGDLFSGIQFSTLYLEASEGNISPSDHFTIDAKNYWAGLKVGNDWDYLWLDRDASYDALVNFEDTTKLTLVTVEIDIYEANNGVIMQDIDLPLELNEFYIQRNDEIVMPDTVAAIKKGASTFTLSFYVDGSKFAAGESNTLWIEMYNANLPADIERTFIDEGTEAWFWTAIEVGRKDQE